MHIVGGNTLRVSGGFNAAGSTSQKDAGIEDAPEIMFEPLWQILGEYSYE
ncbi:MAG: hypothetical protein GYA87_06680 [Christensenellaceae bacterium]|nr:hypothetical protein [Christensenellaceae bacterium]